MSHNLLTLPPAHIQKLVPYQPGKSIESLQQELGLTDIIKLASNENPLGCSPQVQAALANIDPHTIATYPSAAHHPLHRHLSEKLHLSPQQLLLANGSDALFTLLMTTFVLHTNKHILTHEYAFSAYAIQARALGIPVHIVPDHEDKSVNIQAMMDAITPQTGLVFLASPNNPTGLSVPQADLKKLLHHLPEQTLFALDEAYFEYHVHEESTLEWLKTYPNLVLLRTFSKLYGLAGLRIGYAMADPEIIQLLQRVQLPFTINQVAMCAAYAALHDEAFLEKSLTLTQTGKPQLETGLKQLHLTPLPSDANFITVDCHQPAQPIYQALLHHGIIVRPLGAHGLDTYLRITIGTAVQNTRVLRALKDILTTRNDHDVTLKQ